MDSLALGRALRDEEYRGETLLGELKKFKSLSGFLKLHPEIFEVAAIGKYTFKVRLVKPKATLASQRRSVTSPNHALTEVSTQPTTSQVI